MQNHLPSMFPGYKRTLRCANASFNGMMALAVVGAATYAIWTRAGNAWQVGLVIVAAAMAMVWGGYYALLRMRVDERGISIHSLMPAKHYAWDQLLSADFQEFEHNGIARCSIELVFHGGKKLIISSTLMEPEKVRELAEDMHQAGILPNAPAHSLQ